jgi:hypothetical protein
MSELRDVVIDTTVLVKRPQINITNFERLSFSFKEHKPNHSKDVLHYQKPYKQKLKKWRYLGGKNWFGVVIATCESLSLLKYLSECDVMWNDAFGSETEVQREHVWWNNLCSLSRESVPFSQEICLNNIMGIDVSMLSAINNLVSLNCTSILYILTVDNHTFSIVYY